jgi:hypothetical protein
MLISETHFTGKIYIRIPRYIAYHTSHPAGTARGGTALILKSSIQHHALNPYSHSFLKATSVTVEDTAGSLTISAVYLPPRHSIQQEELEDFFDTLGRRFIADGDYNAKHTEWGSRLTSPRGGVLLKTLESRNYRHLSSGEPTYWSTDLNKLPDLLDFCVTKGIHSNFATAKSCFELSSGHSPVLFSLSTQAPLLSPLLRLYNQRTTWEAFDDLINERLQLHVPLKTESDIEDAVKNFNDTIQWVAWNTTPPHSDVQRVYDCPILIKQKLLDKTRLRRKWHRLRTPESKRLLNTDIRELKQLLSDNNNTYFQAFLQDLSPTASTDYSLWKAAKRTKETTNFSLPLQTARGTWARTNTEKAQTFAEHLASVFQILLRLA